jgi:metal iron transporter
MAVAIGMGQNGINALLVASQVVLSLVLPFVTLPLLICTSRKDMMRARKIPSDGDEQPAGEGGDIEGGEQWVDYSNGKIVIGLGALIWIIILVANAYVLIDLAMTA